MAEHILRQLLPLCSINVILAAFVWNGVPTFRGTLYRTAYTLHGRSFRYSKY